VASRMHADIFRISHCGSFSVVSLVRIDRPAGIVHKQSILLLGVSSVWRDNDHELSFPVFLLLRDELGGHIYTKLRIPNL
jgi:hypothetical protein